MALPFKSGFMAFTFLIFRCTLLAFGQITQPTSAPTSEQQLSGSISGTILDRTGAVISGARIQLTRADQSPARETLSGADGQFSFSNVARGPFQLTITSAGFAAQTSSGTLQVGEVHVVPPITLAIAQADTEVQVSLTPTEIDKKKLEMRRNNGYSRSFRISTSATFRTSRTYGASATCVCVYYKYSVCYTYTLRMDAQHPPT